MAFLQIISDNILPLLVFVFIGYMLDRKYKLDVASFTKLTFFIVLPCFIFYSIYVAEIDISMLHVFLDFPFESLIEAVGRIAEIT